MMVQTLLCKAGNSDKWGCSLADSISGAMLFSTFTPELIYGKCEFGLVVTGCSEGLMCDGRKHRFEPEEVRACLDTWAWEGAPCLPANSRPNGTVSQGLTETLPPVQGG